MVGSAGLVQLEAVRFSPQHHKREVSMSGSSIVKAVAGAALAATLWSSALSAGPVADFERALEAAYGPYKAALFHTNSKDKDGTEKSIASFEAQWAKLMATYRGAPPPQYVDDADWAKSMTAIDQMIATAKAQTAKGDLAKAHDVLEGVRDQLAALRVRNGIIVYSDRVDAYHEHMEHVLTGKYAGPEGLAKLREDMAVLVHLAEQLEKYAPVAVKGEEAFKQGLAALVGSTRALQAAARGGDAEAIGKAMKGIKPAYAKFFVRHG
jgi:hypothetical protein